MGILGGEITVPGLLGDMNLKIPAGTQSHQKIRMIGKGIPRLNGYGKGDHYMHIKIHLPKFLSEEQKKALIQFAESDDSVRGTVHGVDKERRKREEEIARQEAAQQAKEAEELYKKKFAEQEARDRDAQPEQETVEE